MIYLYKTENWNNYTQSFRGGDDKQKLMGVLVDSLLAQRNLSLKLKLAVNCTGLRGCLATVSSCTNRCHHQFLFSVWIARH